MTTKVDARLSDDTLCRRCGVCCMGTLRINGRPVAVRGLACRYLQNQGSGRYGCLVYARRHAVAPWCLSVEQALAAGVLARDCPYRVPDEEATDAPVLLSESQERRLGPLIREAADRDPPSWL